VLVDFDLQVEFCCWSNTAEAPPFRSPLGDGGRLGGVLATLEQDPTFKAFQRSGLLGRLSGEARAEIAERVKGESFVNECHLCLALMQEANRNLWERHVSEP